MPLLCTNNRLSSRSSAKERTCPTTEIASISSLIHQSVEVMKISGMIEKKRREDAQQK
jgi:hypothetical protein